MVRVHCTVYSTSAIFISNVVLFKSYGNDKIILIEPGKN